MQVDVLINARAGGAKTAHLRKKISDALFRCDLHFFSPQSIQETHTLIRERTLAGTQAILLCGGDGTLNSGLVPLMQLRSLQVPLPSICVIPIGTANDLANEMKVTRRIDHAARVLLDGKMTLVDVLEVTAGGETKYMLTNGGLGVPAQTASHANWIRSKIFEISRASSLPPPARVLAQATAWTLQKIGPRIYDALLVGDILAWQTKKWRVQIDVPGREPFRTSAPFILISNQKSLGGGFQTAPYTSNVDGTFNVLLIEPTRLLPQVKAVLNIRQGRLPRTGICPSFEVEAIRLKLKDAQSPPFTFFGDGEILHRNVREVSIRCIHPGLPILAMERHS